MDYRLMGRTKDTHTLIFCKEMILHHCNIYISVIVEQSVCYAVVYMVVRAVCVVTGPGPVIFISDFSHYYGFTEICQTVDLADASLFDAHHVVVQLRDCG